MSSRWEETLATARTLGLTAELLDVRSEQDVRAAFDAALRLQVGALLVGIDVYSVEYSGFVDLAARSPSERPDALFVGDSALFNARRVQLAHWATHHRVPATYPGPQYVEAGGLMSYGASLTDASRQMGVYAGRILKGSKPADLPVVQSTKFELVINAWSARMLGLAVPPTLIATADEIIE